MLKKFCAKLYYDDDRPKRIEANRNNEGFLSTIVFYVIYVIWCMSLVEIFKGTAVSRNNANAQKSRA
ncbi:hypothetical protein, partial [Synechococcus sp. CS-1328]|uniref:hypothetical protein n=1 Tax=Synechococcus sp. CS-1328 TaxID=2847976 RepID=UPI00223BF10B